MSKYLSAGADFSDCRNYRYKLWRSWDFKKPHVMFIGLNPSTANETKDDATIRRVVSIAKNLGYGGVYMMNCFPFISTDPKLLYACTHSVYNEEILKETSELCTDVIFAWGDFPVVKKLGVDYILHRLFPDAKALIINKTGSPRHPLYVPTKTQPVKFK